LGESHAQIKAKEKVCLGVEDHRSNINNELVNN
jgi:hypothetical protein